MTAQQAEALATFIIAHDDRYQRAEAVTLFDQANTAMVVATTPRGGRVSYYDLSAYADEACLAEQPLAGALEDW